MFVKFILVQFALFAHIKVLNTVHNSVACRCFLIWPPWLVLDDSFDSRPHPPGSNRKRLGYSGIMGTTFPPRPQARRRIWQARVFDRTENLKDLVAFFWKRRLNRRPLHQSMHATNFINYSTNRHHHRTTDPSSGKRSASSLPVQTTVDATTASNGATAVRSSVQMRRLREICRA
ncbi:hypothetical protein ZWY2020_001484 [Hordeum vulgare]|nr:hypothetical protein ZWY2020_001484 [Hordeum vulgare]